MSSLCGIDVINDERPTLGFLFNFNTGARIWSKERLGNGIETPLQVPHRCMSMLQYISTGASLRVAVPSPQEGGYGYA